MLEVLRAQCELWLQRFVARFEPSPLAALHTERLLLRDFQPEDFSILAECYEDPWVVRNLFGAQARPAAAAGSVVYAARFDRWQPRRAHYGFAIELAESGELIGDCALTPLVWNDSGAPPDAAAIGFVLHPRHWGRGYGTEAARALVRFAFEELGLSAVYGGCLPENIASRRVLEKAGLRFQDKQRGFPGAPRGAESLVFRLNREEWIEAAEPEEAGRSARSTLPNMQTDV
jgi:[ribosomal protein S5]-alanine N-acetyltransferase